MKHFTVLTTLLLALAFTFWGCSTNESAEGSDEFSTKSLNSQYESIKLSQVVGSLENPWSVAFLSDGRFLVTERPGRLNVIENGQAMEISGIPDVSARGQGGLLEVLPHHSYDENGWIYLTYSKPNGGNETATALLRGRIDENYEFVDVEELFEQNLYSSPGRHYGSRLAWMSDGTLLMSIGDRGGDPPRAQETEDHAGTLLRLNDDGSVPNDNPFVNDNSVADEIYSYGHRNIQGLIVNHDNNEIWGTEHGPRGGDELNKINAGENYGWPTVTLGRDYGSQGIFPGSEARTMEGMVDPIYEFLPTHAPSGLALVTSDEFPVWKGNLLAGGLRSERIRRLVIENNTVIHDEELLLGEIGRIRDVRQGPDGKIYVLTDHEDGALYVMEQDD